MHSMHFEFDLDTPRVLAIGRKLAARFRLCFSNQSEAAWGLGYAFMLLLLDVNPVDLTLSTFMADETGLCVAVVAEALPLLNVTAESWTPTCSLGDGRERASSLPSRYLLCSTFLDGFSELVYRRDSLSVRWSEGAETSTGISGRGICSGDR